MLAAMSSPQPRPEFATLTEDDLVTGEAVALDLPPAGLGLRMVSGMIDVILTVVILLILAVLVITSVINTDQALVNAGVILCLIATFLVLPTTVETLTRGRSVGKLVMGLRTVRDDAGPITAQHAFVRALVGFVEIYAFSGMPALLTAMVSPRGKRLGDYAAGTYVVRDRVRLTLPPAPVMPPPLAHWAAGADITSLPTGLALAVRSFLLRAPQIAPGTRQAMAQRLATEVAPHVAPTPPPGTPAEAFLAAVMASRRDRDATRLRREADLRQRLVGRALTR